jgi:hypothetical protein
VFSKFKIFKFLKRDWGTIPVAEIINGKIEITFFIFALSQNGARRNDMFNGFPFSSANPTFINDRL